MPSDYLDYENNLAFAPTSADDLNEQKRDSEVLVAALEKCEKLEKQLNIAVKFLKMIEKNYSEEYNLAGRLSYKALTQIEGLDK